MCFYRKVNIKKYRWITHFSVITIMCGGLSVIINMSNNFHSVDVIIVGALTLANRSNMVIILSNFMKFEFEFELLPNCVWLKSKWKQNFTCFTKCLYFKKF